jgi:hypothetical protein
VTLKGVEPWAKSETARLELTLDSESRSNTSPVFAVRASASVGVSRTQNRFNLVLCAKIVTAFPRKALILTAIETTNYGGISMRVFLACAIIIAGAVGLAGCFHHQQATYAAPMPSTQPLK